MTEYIPIDSNKLEELRSLIIDEIGSFNPYTPNIISDPIATIEFCIDYLKNKDKKEHLTNSELGCLRNYLKNGSLRVNDYKLYYDIQHKTYLITYFYGSVDKWIELIFEDKVNSRDEVILFEKLQDIFKKIN